MSRKMNIFIASICLVFSLATQPGLAQPSSEVCNSSGGPELCVRFDNMANPPQEGTDFTLTYASGVPSIDLTRGDNGAGTIFEWRIWSRVSPTDATPAAIGSITGSAADDYKVTVLNASGTAGASDVDDIDIDPSDAANFANLGGLDITGDLGDLTLVKDSGGSGGDIVGDVVIDGNVTARIGVVGILKSTGRILIDGKADAEIAIGESTAALSLIRATEGLDTNGVVVVNDSEGDFNHAGTIHIGAPSSPSGPFVYDGCIRIKDDSVDGSHGDNDGRITVVGCLGSLLKNNLFCGTNFPVGHVRPTCGV